MSGMKNNATSKILGFEYQKLIAIEMCLNAKKNEIIYLECFGDISDGSVSIESKHHAQQQNMGDRDIDFWKTLYNIIYEYEELKLHDRFELHTTAVLNNSSIFLHWDKITEDEKYELLKNAGFTKTTEKYYNYIFSTTQSIMNVKSILSKMNIIHSLPVIKEKIKLLKEHKSFTIINESRRDIFIQKLIGYITTKAFDDSLKWSIDKNEFDRDLQFLAKNFINDDIPFPNIDKNNKLLISPDNNRSFYFIKEMTEIGFRQRDITIAVNYHIRAELSRLEMIKLIPAEPIDNFDDELQDEMHDIKNKHYDAIKAVDFRNGDINMKSKSLYRECLEINKISINGVSNIAPYYYKGRMHSCIAPDSFSLKFEEGEI